MQKCKKTHTWMFHTRNNLRLTVWLLNGAYSHSFSNTVTHFMPFEAQIHILRIYPWPVTISISLYAPPSPPPIMPGQCMMWGRNRVGGVMGCVACNYRSLAGPVAVMWNSQIKVQPEDSASPAAALCYLIAGSWVSHVKWQAGKCEITDKAQSPKKPWSSSNEESDVVWACLGGR